MTGPTPVEARPDGSERAMSAGDLRVWLTGARPALAEAGIDAVHGAGPRLVADGATWISFTSRRGSGRLVRAVDGSSVSKALRNRDGVAVIDRNAPTTTVGQLEALMSALGAGSSAADP